MESPCPGDLCLCCGFGCSSRPHLPPRPAPVGGPCLRLCPARCLESRWLLCPPSLPPVTACVSQVALRLLPGRGVHRCPSHMLSPLPRPPEPGFRSGPSQLPCAVLPGVPCNLGRAGGRCLGDIVEPASHRATQAASGDLGAAVLAGPSHLWTLPHLVAHCGLSSSKAVGRRWGYRWL